MKGTDKGVLHDTKMLRTNKKSILLKNLALFSPPYKLSSIFNALPGLGSSGTVKWRGLGGGGGAASEGL